MAKRTAKLRSMKLSKAEAKKRYSPLASTRPKGDQYPWGLSISLDKAGMEKLGLKEAPKVGTVMTVTAKAKVSSRGEHESDEGGASRDCCLQITDLAVE